ncbi:MAG: hypothetical protein AAB688_01250 [Patescibacteria group bacterium]
MDPKYLEEILKEAGVPPEYHEKLLNQHKNDNGTFKLNCSPESIKFFAEKFTERFVEKGCVSAPW